MKRTPITPDFDAVPERLHPFLHCPVFDSSCSPEARVWYLDTLDGLFLKTAPKGTLAQEAAGNRYFHQLGLGPQVLDYFTEKDDWLLTRAIPGEDCTHEVYLADPKRLCDTTAELLRQLHDRPITNCPLPDRMKVCYANANQGFRQGYWEPDLFQGQWDFSTREEAWNTVQANFSHMRTDTLLHGDYCLPNILLNSWQFSGFIDLGNAGIGDKHMDILWGTWTLQFNLKTNAYHDRFLDAYGRDHINPDLLRTAAAIEILTVTE